MAPSDDLMPVFDGHNDVLLRLWRQGPVGAEERFLNGEVTGHLDLPRIRKGGFAGGLFAIFVPGMERGSDGDAAMRQTQYDMPLPPEVKIPDALPVTLALAALLVRIERASRGQVQVCTTAAGIRDCMARGVLAPVMHIEGAEAIDPDLYALDVLVEAGLRSIGPVWSRSNIFGHGVPFRFPSSPDTGPGLTEAGERLVKACDRLGIMIDLSHITEKGFWDVARQSTKPLVASHSNAHSVTPHSRNLTDRQLDAIRESRGIVGINYACAFLRQDGRMIADTPLDDLLRHADHLIERLGVDHVGLGSDFDGAVIPAAMKDAAGLPALVAAMRRHGYDEATLRKICHENWLNVLERTWGA
ncbi:dipeptidase [Lutibaculum baratangense]|uniref:Microsomal dipeptidase n=1 Tax=Lutibaculum baratangense AMV1 TaxID=631454 RepID=V4T748_9HYPH|nr:dipeptidase [Lutibaculum baratangense]ESR22443.1 Microsomal dipeptidase [Lutibaculum baratangense AMV1]